MYFTMYLIYTDQCYNYFFDFKFNFSFKIQRNRKSAKDVSSSSVFFLLLMPFWLSQLFQQLTSSLSFHIIEWFIFCSFLTKSLIQFFCPIYLVDELIPELQKRAFAKWPKNLQWKKYTKDFQSSKEINIALDFLDVV